MLSSPFKKQQNLSTEVEIWLDTNVPCNCRAFWENRSFTVWFCNHILLLILFLPRSPGGDKSCDPHRQRRSASPSKSHNPWMLLPGPSPIASFVLLSCDLCKRIMVLLPESETKRQSPDSNAWWVSSVWLRAPWRPCWAWHSLKLPCPKSSGFKGQLRDHQSILQKAEHRSGEWVPRPLILDADQLAQLQGWIICVNF